MSYLDKLKLMTAPEERPELSDDDLGECLAQAALMDAAGNAPSSEDWTPTYDLNGAATKAWLMKAARASGGVEVEGTDPIIVTSKVFDNCRAMARIFASKRGATVSVVE